jgi:hypothetical protein
MMARFPGARERSHAEARRAPRRPRQKVGIIGKNWHKCASSSALPPAHPAWRKFESKLSQSRAAFEASAANIWEGRLALTPAIDAINAIPSNFNVPFKRAAKRKL